MTSSRMEAGRDPSMGKARQNPRLTSMERYKDGSVDRKNFGCDQPDRVRERVDRSEDRPRDRLDHSRDRPRDRLDRSKDRPTERMDRARDQLDRERRDLSRDLREDRRRREHSADYREPQAFEIESEELDPRVQEELEKLNSCTDEINRLEVQLDEANLVFRRLLSDSTHHLKALHTRLGGCIEKARPYYEALEQMMRAQAECQQAAVQFQRAAGIHAAAKETISLAEERFLDNSGEWQFDNAWQEMLNHATIKVMDAEKQRTASEKEHLARSAAFSAAEARVKALEKKLSRHIDKSKPYFEQKTTFNKALNSEKNRVQSLQTKICQSKAQYAQSLRNLEEISESIHARRKYSKQRMHQQDCTQSVDSLTFDLEQCVWSRAGSELSLSEATSGRDSALGSASLVGEASSLYQTEDEATGGMLVPEACSQQQAGRAGVSRSVSLPDQLGSLGASARLVVPVTAAAGPGVAKFRGRLEATADEEFDVRSISDATPPIQL